MSEKLSNKNGKVYVQGVNKVKERYCVTWRAFGKSDDPDQAKCFMKTTIWISGWQGIQFDVSHKNQMIKSYLSFSF